MAATRVQCAWSGAVVYCVLIVMARHCGPGYPCRLQPVLPLLGVGRSDGVETLW